jgi:hypothetical protein
LIAIETLKIWNKKFSNDELETFEEACECDDSFSLIFSTELSLEQHSIKDINRMTAPSKDKYTTINHSPHSGSILQFLFTQFSIPIV